MASAAEEGSSTVVAVAASMAAAGASTGVAADRMSPSGGDVGYDK